VANDCGKQTYYYCLKRHLLVCCSPWILKELKKKSGLIGDRPYKEVENMAIITREI
jgi:hypothetical protein